MKKDDLIKLGKELVIAIIPVVATTLINILKKLAVPAGLIEDKKIPGLSIEERQAKIANGESIPSGPTKTDIIEALKLLKAATAEYSSRFKDPAAAGGMVREITSNNDLTVKCWADAKSLKVAPFSAGPAAPAGSPRATVC